jgi:hypothetical protein
MDAARRARAAVRQQALQRPASRRAAHVHEPAHAAAARLEEFGIVRREAAGKVWEYSLTEAGEELRPIVMALGHWGARWIGSRLREDELDAGLLMWDMRRFARVEEFPRSPW